MNERTRPATACAIGFKVPRLVIAEGTLQALKWLALALMTVDHVNKYLLHGAVSALFDAGRLAIPLFAFVLAYNLARPGAQAGGAFKRIAPRLAVAAAVATVPFIALGGLGWGWWPLNILAMLLVATSAIGLLESGGQVRAAAAVALFVAGGSAVEFWWPGLAVCLASWCYCKHPGRRALLAWIGATWSLSLINGNAWALAALPLIFAAPHVDIDMPRWRMFFYLYYPAHLMLLWSVRILMS